LTAGRLPTPQGDAKGGVIVKKRLLVMLALVCVIGAVVATTASAAITDPGNDGCHVLHGPGLSWVLQFCGD
jgi:hypothetical protein